MQVLRKTMCDQTDGANCDATAYGGVANWHLGRSQQPSVVFPALRRPMASQARGQHASIFAINTDAAAASLDGRQGHAQRVPRTARTFLR